MGGFQLGEKNGDRIWARVKGVEPQRFGKSERGRPYLSQLHSAKANRFLAVRHNPPAKIQELQGVVATVDDGHSSILFGIFSRGARGHY